MIKHHWEYEIKIEEIEEEPKKPQREFTAREMEALTVGCFGLLFGIAMLIFGILLFVSLFTVKF